MSNAAGSFVVAGARRAGPTAAILRGSGLGVAAEALVLPAGLLTAAFLTRTLGPELYGRLATVYALTAPVAWVAATVFAGRGAVKLLAEASDWRPTAAVLLRANLLFGAAAAVLFAVLARPLAAAFGDAALTPLLWLAAGEILLMPLVRLHRDVLIARGRLNWPAAVSASYHLGRLALIVAIVTAGFGLTGVVIANTFARLLELAVCRVRLRVPLRGRMEHGLWSSRGLLGALFLYALCVQIFNRLDLLLLAAWRVPADVLGHFGAAQNLAIAPGLAAAVFTPMLIAALRHAELMGDRAGADALRLQSTHFALTLCALIAPVAAGATPIVVLFFGAQFTAAGPIFALLGLAAGAVLLLSVLAAHEVAQGRYRRPLLAAMPMLFVAGGLHLLLIPRYGALGAAVSTAAAAALAACIAIALVARERTQQLVGDVVRAAVAAAGGAASTWLGMRVGAPGVPAILAGVLVAAAAAFALGILRVTELSAAARATTAGGSST